MPLTFNGKPVLCQQLLLTCVVYGIYAMSKHTCTVLCMVTEKKKEYQQKMCFFIFTKHMKKQKICSKLISHISSDDQCAVYMCVTIQHHPFSTPAKRERAIRRYIS